MSIGFNIDQDSDAVTWDHEQWLNLFHHTNDFRGARRLVFANTVAILKSRRYLSANGKKVDIDADAIRFSHTNSVFCPDTRLLSLPESHRYETQAYAIGSDCLEVARLMSLAGFKPAMLNMADSHNPGGGVASGSGAQEENLFRRSSALSALYQYVDYCDQYGVSRNAAFSYPIPKESGGIYSPSVTVFRSSEMTGYYLLDKPFEMDIITVAAIANPSLEKVEGRLQLTRDWIEPAREKIRAIFRLGAMHGNDCLVLGAFGCGAFRNPPNHIAELFSHVLKEDEFRDRFRLIVFAIIDDHNAHKEHNPLGNKLPFQLLFNR
jgi:uncharacterized protein (TIGR02452 family)